MSLLFNRLFLYFTVLSYLVIGSLVVRFATQNYQTISFDPSYMSLLQQSSVASTIIAEIKAPEQNFEEIKIAKRQIILPVKKTVLEVVQIAKNELNFHTPIELQKINFNGSLIENLTALFVPMKSEEVLVASVEKEELTDEINMQASSVIEVDADPIFFEYETNEEIKEEELKAVVEKIVETEVIHKAANNTPEEIEIDDLVAFDYSKAAIDVATKNIPVISGVTTQIPEVKKAASHKMSGAKKKPNTSIDQEEEEYRSDEKSSLLSSGYSSRVAIQAGATDLKNVTQLNGFEIRYQDDLSAGVEDFGSGEIIVEENLANPAMTRSITLLKHGFAPTNTDLILEKGEHGVSLPMISMSIFNELQAPYESRGPVGALLVELDDATEIAQLDVQIGEVRLLDGNLKETSAKDYRYQLFLGVTAGNILLTYKDDRGRSISKIVHVHERELTFESNYYEDVGSETVALFEEDLLAKEKSPLRIAADDVKVFTKTQGSSKINDHTYKLNFDSSLLATRKYIELRHQQEPVFVGVRDNNKVIVPSENFMRHVLSQIEGARLNNRCLIQINLDKEAARVDVGSESVANSLMTFTQLLDSDGKFYDSVGEKSRKVIVVGENQGASEFNQDAKINFKVTYADGSVQFVGSYCSPNTYLVEQL